MVIEGLAVAVFARSIPELMAELEHFGQSGLRRAGVLMAIAGAAAYLWIRAPAGG